MCEIDIKRTENDTIFNLLTKLREDESKNLKMNGTNYKMYDRHEKNVFSGVHIIHYSYK